MRKLRIVLVLHDLSRTGAPRFAVEVMRRMRDIADFWVISLLRGPLEGDAWSLGPVYNLARPAVHSPADGPKVLRHYLARTRWPERFARWQPDLIYLNSIASLPVVDIFRLPDAPVLLHVHELETLLDFYSQKAPGQLQTLPERIIAVSEVTRQALIRDHQVSPEKIRVINAFIDRDTFERLQRVSRESARSEQDRGKFIVGGAGRIGWRKGMEAWLRSAVHLKSRLGPERLRYIWVGGEDDLQEREFLTMAQKLGVGDILEIVPMTPDPFPHYRRFDAFAMTSWEDPCPAVVIENMALENPVACFAGSGGAQDQVGDTGFVIPGFDPSSMGEALFCLAVEEARRRALGEAARQRVLDRFTDDALMPSFREEIRRTARPGWE